MKKNIFLIVLSLAFNKYNSQIIDDGYTDKWSYRVGEEVIFYTKTDITNGGNATYSIKDFKNSITKSVDLVTNSNSSTNNNLWENGYGYSESGRYTVTSDMKSGLYFLENSVPFIVKGNKGADIIVVYPSNTDNAYNKQGGKSFYDPETSYAHKLSFSRLQKRQPDADGFLNWFLGNSSYQNYSVISDRDMDDYSEINGSKLIILIGHAEYWTRKARENLDKFVNNGGDIIVLSGNSLWWQVRYDNNANTLVCYKVGGLATADPDNIDPLLETTSYNKEPLNFSISGSIGAAWTPYGYFNHSFTNSNGTYQYTGFKGYKIIAVNSPLFQGTNLYQNDTLKYDYINPKNHDCEYDAILINGYNNGIPIFDPNRIGFYRGEIVAYDKVTQLLPIQGDAACSPIAVLQRNKTSGKIINTSAHKWCSESWFKNDIVTVTKNMIDKLLSKQEVFSNPERNFYSFKPNEYTVGYRVLNNGSVRLTPDGVYSSSNNDNIGVFVVDNTNEQSIKLYNCNNCGIRLKNVSSEYQSSPYVINQKLNENVRIYPSPFKNVFNISSNGLKNQVVNVEVYNMAGAILHSASILSKTSIIELDFTAIPYQVNYIIVFKHGNKIHNHIVYRVE